jgi:hypothetical protein
MAGSRPARTAAKILNRLMALRLAKQALAAYVFFPATGPDREESYAHLLRTWSGCRDLLGMSEAVPELALPAELPAAPPPVDGPDRLAARQCPGRAAIEQALVLRAHDVYCLLVMLAPPTSARAGWRQLDERWAAVAAMVPTGAVVGEARLYLALVTRQQEAGAAGGHAILAAAEEAVRATLPAPAHAREGWWRAGAATSQGFALWEAAPSDDSRPQRRIAVAAASEREKALDAWAWTGGGTPVLPPFGRYLLHAAKVRYELRVHAGGEQVRQLRSQADARVGDLLGLLARQEQPDGAAASEDDLIAASVRLIDVQAGSAGLIHAATRLREMRRTVQIAAANMAAALDPDPEPGDAGPLADDRALAAWLAQQLDDDAVYLEAARERTRDVAAVTATVIQHRLQQRREAADQRRERFNLLQTAIIGAIILALTAVPALGYQLPVPGPVKPPVIAALGAIALLLASIVVRLALPSGRQPLAWLAYTAAGLTAAAFTWLAVAWISLDALHRLAAPVTTRIAAATVFAIVTATAHAASTRRSGA